jgi:hypothetical protein
MKTMAIVGYVFAVLIFVGGCVASTNPNLPMQGFSGVIAGATGALLFVLPSTALLGIAQLLKK